MNSKKEKSNVIQLPKSFWNKNKNEEDRTQEDWLFDMEKVKQSILEDMKNKKLFAWLEDFKDD